MEDNQELNNHLFKGTVIYFIGTFISKAVTVLILPIITTVLSPKEYGYYDLLLTITMFIMPIFTLESIEAVFRFLFNADAKRKKELLSVVWVIIFCGTLLCAILLIVCNTFIYKLPYGTWLLLYYISTVLLQMYQRVARSLGLGKQFAISGVINTVVLVIAQSIMLLVFGLKVEGLVIGYIIATFVSCVFLEHYTKSIASFSPKAINASTISEICKFGFPLIPNTMSWWAVSFINKMLIIIVLGAGSNGVFAITAKFTAILSMFTEVFRLSWQESAIIAYDKPEKTKFYSTILNNYILLLFIGCCAILPLIKIFLPFLVSQDYQMAWKYVPLSMFGACLSSIAAFYGVGYSASQKTKDAFGTTIFAGIVNVVVCALLIKYIGLYAPALSTAVAYLTLWIIRQVRMKSYFRIEISSKNIVSVVLICFFSTLIYYIANNVVNLIMFVLLIVLLCIKNKNLIEFVLTKIGILPSRLKN